MNHLKSILAELHGKNKELLWQIYLDRHVWIKRISSSEQPVEEERVFSYHGLDFQFVGTGSRHPERMNLFIFIPEQLVDEGHSFPCVPMEDYLPRTRLRRGLFQGSHTRCYHSRCKFHKVPPSQALQSGSHGLCWRDSGRKKRGICTHGKSAWVASELDNV